MGLARAGRTDQQDVGLLDSHIPQIGVGDDRVGGVLSQVSTNRLKWFGDAKGEPPLGDILPNHELVQVGNQDLGGGIEARRASFEGRSGGGVGSGTGWGVISARALVAQKAQMRVVESKPPS